MGEIDSHAWTGRQFSWGGYTNWKPRLFCAFFTIRPCDFRDGERSDAYGLDLARNLLGEFMGIRLYWGQREVWLWKAPLHGDHHGKREGWEDG